MFLNFNVTQHRSQGRMMGLRLSWVTLTAPQMPLCLPICEDSLASRGFGQPQLFRLTPGWVFFPWSYLASKPYRIFWWAFLPSFIHENQWAWHIFTGLAQTVITRSSPSTLCILYKGLSERAPQGIVRDKYRTLVGNCSKLLVPEPILKKTRAVQQ